MCHYNVTARCVISVSARCIITVLKVEVLLYVHRNRRLIRDGSPGRPPWLSHSSWAHFSVNARCVITVGARCVITVSALGVSLQCQRSLCHYSVSVQCVITVSALDVSLQSQSSVRHYSVSAGLPLQCQSSVRHYRHSVRHYNISVRCFIAESALGASLHCQRSVRHYSVSAQCVITGARCVITTSALDVSSQSQRSVRRYSVSTGCVISVSAQWDNRVPALALILQCQRSAAVALFVSTVMMTATTGGLYTTISDWSLALLWWMFDVPISLISHEETQTQRATVKISTANHIKREVSSWILTPRQPHGVTSGTDSERECRKAWCTRRRNTVNNSICKSYY